jgi:hypothetical protein
MRLPEVRFSYWEEAATPPKLNFKTNYDAYAIKIPNEKIIKKTGNGCNIPGWLLPVNGCISSSVTKGYTEHFLSNRPRSNKTKV